jgi:hypothetical protein
MPKHVHANQSLLLGVARREYAVLSPVITSQCAVYTRGCCCKHRYTYFELLYDILSSVSSVSSGTRQALE